MKLKSIACLVFPLLCGAAIPAHSQDLAALYFMDVIPQTTQLNPAFQPRGNVFVSLPSVHLGFRSDLAVKNILQQHGSQWYLPIEKQFDYALLYGAIGKKSTMFNANADINLLGFGFRLGKGYLSFGISEQIVVTAALPSDLFKIPEATSLDDATLDFSPLRMKAMVYKQISIGYSRIINDRLTVGVNLKPLFGQVALSTKLEKFTIKTGVNEWAVDIKGEAHSSTPITLKEKEGDEFPDIEMNEMETSDYVSKYGTSLSNPGIALDLGATYRYNEWFTFSAALNNLGFISWRNDLNGLSFGGHYTFNGITYSTADDDTDKPFDALADTLKTIVDYHTQHERFSTSLPPVLYLGATCHLTKSISVGLLSRSTFWSKGYRQNLNLSLNLQPYSFVALNLGLNQQIKGNTYFGGGFSLYLGPLQFYLLTDYIPVRYSTVTIDGDKIPFVPERQKEIIIRTGLNFVFGKSGYVSRPMLDKRKANWY
ncbi:MAG: DUF5723 family protein [Prevotellaceae bacterium]|jgi:hypothetical protein|nr:DUF5723 family protein [Prevotellaceae bacterium]